jgi:hypothetical protein
MGLWAMGYGLLAGRNGSREPLDRHAAKGALAMTDQPIANSQ